MCPYPCPCRNSEGRRARPATNILGLKGTPVKFEFDIFIEDIKPWSDGATIPLLLAWQRGSNRSGTTKTVVPSVGRIAFNESFRLPATLFERSSGQIQKKCVTFALIEDENAKAIKISRQLATGEIDLSQFVYLTEPRCVSIPMTIALSGSNSGSDPYLSLRISSSGRLPSPSIFSGRLSSGGRADSMSQRTSYILPETDDSDGNESDEIDSFTDDEDSPRSSYDNTMSTKKIPASKRDQLFSATASASSDASKFMSSNPVIARVRTASPAPSDDNGQSSGSSFDAKADAETSKSSLEPPKLSEEEKRKKLLGLNLTAPPGRALAKAANSLEAAPVSAGKSIERSVEAVRQFPVGRNLDRVATSAGSTVEAARKSAEKSVEAVKATSAGTNLEAVVASAGLSKTADIAASATKMVEEAATSLEKSVSSASAKVSAGIGKSPAVQAAAAYATMKVSQIKESRLSQGSTPEGSTPGTFSPIDTGGKLELYSRSIDSATASSSSSQVQPEKKWSYAGYQSDGSKSVLSEARAKIALVEKRAIEELRSKVAAAEAKAVANEEKGKEIARDLKQQLLKREDELRDTAAIEVALYSIVAEHTSSSHKVHTPARRLARLYVYAYKNCNSDRHASAARNAVQGLVVVVRACGNDVPRLTYWWSNIVVLRESIMQACNAEPTTDPDVATPSGIDSSYADRAKQYQQQHTRTTRTGSTYEILGFKHFNNKWQDCNTFVVALLKVETWIHGRILECVWWQAMAPPMQVGGSDRKARAGALGETFINVRDELNRIAGKVKDGLGELNKFAGDVKEFFTKERQDGKISQLGDARQGIISIEIWKNAFADALKRLCPLQGHEGECGCLPVLSRQVISECVDRLDVALFNGIMRNPGEDSPTDPLADPVTDLSVLPIPVGALTFGAGSQLKNAVVTWSTWLSTLLSVKAPTESNIKDNSSEHSEHEQDDNVLLRKRYSIVKTASDLLMVPKDMIEMAMRREC
nr:uncharacterized protein LOC112292889 isoform X4 [Physcomitrium patens]|eukprot:XP_024397619.1 uncharacterized protein LOC112292889 isoform X4 [Physcomitrella patens]